MTHTADTGGSGSSAEREPRATQEHNTIQTVEHGMSSETQQPTLSDKARGKRPCTEVTHAHTPLANDDGEQQRRQAPRRSNEDRCDGGPHHHETEFKKKHETEFTVEIINNSTLKTPNRSTTTGDTTEGRVKRRGVPVQDYSEIKRRRGPAGPDRPKKRKAAGGPDRAYMETCRNRGGRQKLLKAIKKAHTQ